MKRLPEAFKRLAISAVALPVALSASNGALQIGYGVRSQGMGGASIAYPQDSFAAATNPAGLATLGCRFDAGLHYASLDGDFKTVAVVGGTTPDTSHSGFHTDQDKWLPEVGAIWMINCDQAFGLSFYQVGQWRVSSNRAFTAFETDGYTLCQADCVKARSDLDVYAVTGAYSWRICNNLVGLAVSAVGARLDVDVGNLFESGQVCWQSINDRAINSGREWEWGVNARIGWLGQFCDCFAIGLTYQTRTWLNRFVRYEGLLPEHGHMDFTSQFGFGATWQLLDCLTVSGEAVKVFWDYGRWFENTDMRDRGLWGANNGPGLGWRDQVLLKVGAEYALSDCILLRLGYNYGNTPLPEGTLFNYLTMLTVEHHITVGASYFFCGNSELNLVYVHGFENCVKGPAPKSVLLKDRGNFPFVGNSVRARQNSFGISYGYNF
jgi:long-chain fatty acid transport protein